MLYINKRVHKETAENYGNHEYGMADVNVVTEKKEYGDVTYAIVGEHGRGRQLIKLPLSPGIELKTGLNQGITIGQTKTGRPRINKGQDGNLYMLLSAEGGYTRRGDGYIAAQVEHFDKVEVITKGNGADGDAGRIGYWDCALIKLPADLDTVIKVRTSGAGYGTPTDYYVVHAGQVYHTTGRDEMLECLETLGMAENSYGPQFWDVTRSLTPELQAKMVTFARCGIDIENATCEGTGWVESQDAPYLKFSMTVGTIPGYASENLSDEEINAFQEKLSECLKKISKELEETYHVHLAIDELRDAYSVYPKMFGAPPVGEKSIRVNGALVGELSKEAIKAFEEYFSQAMRGLKQSTVTVEYADGYSSYIKNDENGHEITASANDSVQAIIKIYDYDLAARAEDLQKAMEATQSGEYFITGSIYRSGYGELTFSATQRTEFAPDAEQFKRDTLETIQRAFGEQKNIHVEVEFVEPDAQGHDEHESGNETVGEDE